LDENSRIDLNLDAPKQAIALSVTADTISKVASKAASRGPVAA
jgi:hypothetical protein